MSVFSKIKLDELNEKGYPAGTDIPAEVVRIAQKAKGYHLVELRDFKGAQEVFLIRGKALPTEGDVGSVKMFNLQAETKDGKVKFSGFFNPNKDLPDGAKGKRPPKLEGNARTQKGGVVDEDKRRGVALSYAKDIVCAGVVGVNDIHRLADDFLHWLTTGEWEVKKTRSVPVPEPEVEELNEGTFESSFIEDDEMPF